MLLAFLKRFTKSRRPPTQIQIVQRDVSRLTANDWRATPDLCKAAAMLLANPVAQQMLDVLRNSHLGHYTFHGSIEDRAIHGARAEGYSMCLRDLQSLSDYSKPDEPLKETFEPETL